MRGILGRIKGLLLLPVVLIAIAVCLAIDGGGLAFQKRDDYYREDY